MSTAEESCRAFEIRCKVDNAVEGAVGGVGQAVGNAAGDQILKFASDTWEAAEKFFTTISTSWLGAGIPDITSEGNPVLRMQQDLGWMAAFFAILGLLIALGRMVFSQDFKSLIQGFMPIVQLIIVTACYPTGIWILSEAGDSYSSWLVTRAASYTGEGDDISILASMGPATFAAMQGASGVFLIFALLMFLSVIITWAFMLFRNVMLVVMLAVMPVLAASSGTEPGNQAFRKANGWLLAFLLFKPTAASIWALGLWFTGTEWAPGATSGDDLVAGMIDVLMGLTIILLAALALPALIKFLVPVAAQGAGAFSAGGAAAAGAATVAAGAAIVATAGAAAPTAGGAAAAGATSTGTAGAAPQAGAAAGSAASGGTGGGAQTNPATGGTGGTPGGAPASAQSASGSQDDKKSDRMTNVSNAASAVSNVTTSAGASTQDAVEGK